MGAEALYSALSGAVARERALEVVSNNLANSSTSGYMAQRSTFAEVLAESVNDEAVVGGSQVSIGESRLDTRVGPLHQTDRALDAALPEGGFFVVSTPSGERFTRAGSFQVAPDGLLVNASGLPVLGRAGPIHLEGGGLVKIEPSGAVSVDGSTVDTLRIVTFERPSALIPEGESLHRAPDALTPLESEQPVASGALVGSNANPIRAMTELVAVSRAFEIYNRAIETVSAVDQTAINKIIG
ncbi:MAG: flagellar hook basal-body protein [Deltaproteobacteria bacterium]|nr:flagellar hook basal-body protein [Deltaproteobacteria bacterium]